MRIPRFIPTVVFLPLVISAPGWPAVSPLELVRTIPLYGVEGRIDHMAADVKGHRLFVAALGNNTVEVINVETGQRLHTIRGLHRPQGVAFVPERNNLYVANEQDGDCDLYDGRSFQRIGSIPFGDDADNLRYDAAEKTVYVGYGGGSLGVIDAATAKRAGDIPLKGHPESFQLEARGPRIFINFPDSGIFVADRKKRAVVGHWPLSRIMTAANYPMALDETHHRLFSVFRWPARLIVFDTESGKIIARLPTVGDADDVFYDAKLARLYVSGGEGGIAVFQQKDADHYEVLARMKTAPGARTSLFVPEWGRLYLAVPHRGAQKAELRIYESHS